VVGIIAVVAIVTPGGDPVSLAVLSVPLVFFYFGSIGLAKIVLRRRAENVAPS
jgi:Sec-independent protein secretion pathway component TatC